MSRNQIFISYSHADKVWLDVLQTNLKPYLRDSSINAWTDKQIKPGADWREEIARALASAKIAVLLVSSDFLASDFIYKEELPYLVGVAKKQEVDLKLIAIRPSAWNRARVTTEDGEEVALESFQWANDPRRPLSRLDKSTREEEIVKICEIIASSFPEKTLPLTSTPGATAPEIVESVSRSAREGLNALGELMHDPEVRDKVATFEAIFSDSRSQIELLAYHKDLHDILHTLQFNCYNYLLGIVRSAKRNPEDFSIWENVVNYEAELRKAVVNKLKKIEQKNIPAHSNQDWIPQLSQDLEALFRAIEECSAEKIETALQPLRKVLAQKPVFINGKLATAAETLQLSRLIAALTDVHKCLDQAKVNPIAVKKFSDGIDALDGLKDSLSALIASHNKWQEIDLDLRLIDGTIAIDQTGLDVFWPSLKNQTNGECAPYKERWAEQLQGDMTKLDQALAEADAVKIRHYFQSFRTRASYRFYEVDLALKELCEQLRKIAEPLTNVWEMIK